MKIDILTLFPQMFTEPLGNSIIGRAQKGNLLNIKIWDIREFARDKHRIVDHMPYGGGPGMVLKADVVVAGIEQVKLTNPGPVIYLSPQGVTFTQKIAEELASKENLIFLCGHYEGVDERVIENWVDREISIGDYVLTGGELPTMVIIDAIGRMIPGVLGAAESYQTDSFYDGLLSHPQYTRPREFRGLKVPDILLSGNHRKIRHWRLREALKRTLLRRGDLLEKRSLTKEEKQILTELQIDLDQRGGA